MAKPNDRKKSWKAKLTWSVITVFSFLVVADRAIGQEMDGRLHQPNEVPSMNPVDLLLSGDMRPVRDLAVDAILQERKALIDQLIPVVDPANREKYGDETRSAAAFLLGELRAVEAVPVLSKALETRMGRIFIEGHLSRYDSPVIVALLKIGRPAVPALLENIESSDSELLRKQSLSVLSQTLGGKRRLLDVLGKCQTRAKDADVKRHLAASIEHVEKNFHEDEEPLY